MITNDVSTCPKCGGDLKYYLVADDPASPQFLQPEADGHAEL